MNECKDTQHAHANVQSQNANQNHIPNTATIAGTVNDDDFNERQFLNEQRAPEIDTVNGLIRWKFTNENNFHYGHEDMMTLDTETSRLREHVLDVEDYDANEYGHFPQDRGESSKYLKYILHHHEKWPSWIPIQIVGSEIQRRQKKHSSKTGYEGPVLATWYLKCAHNGPSVEQLCSTTMKVEMRVNTDISISFLTVHFDFGEEQSCVHKANEVKGGITKFDVQKYDLERLKPARVWDECMDKLLEAKEKMLFCNSDGFFASYKNLEHHYTQHFAAKLNEKLQYVQDEFSEAVALLYQMGIEWKQQGVREAITKKWYTDNELKKRGKKEERCRKKFPLLGWMPEFDPLNMNFAIWGKVCTLPLEWYAFFRDLFIDETSCFVDNAEGFRFNHTNGVVKDPTGKTALFAFEDISGDWSSYSLENNLSKWWNGATIFSKLHIKTVVTDWCRKLMHGVCRSINNRELSEYLRFTFEVASGDREHSELEQWPVLLWFCHGHAANAISRHYKKIKLVRQLVFWYWRTVRLEENYTNWRKHVSFMRWLSQDGWLPVKDVKITLIRPLDKGNNETSVTIEADEIDEMDAEMQQVLACDKDPQKPQQDSGEHQREGFILVCTPEFVEKWQGEDVNCTALHDQMTANEVEMSTLRLQMVNNGPDEATVQKLKALMKKQEDASKQFRFLAENQDARQKSSSHKVIITGDVKKNKFEAYIPIFNTSVPCELNEERTEFKLKMGGQQADDAWIGCWKYTWRYFVQYLGCYSRIIHIHRIILTSGDIEQYNKVRRQRFRGLRGKSLPTYVRDLVADTERQWNTLVRRMQVESSKVKRGKKSEVTTYIHESQYKDGADPLRADERPLYKLLIHEVVNRFEKYKGRKGHAKDYVQSLRRFDLTHKGVLSKRSHNQRTWLATWGKLKGGTRWTRELDHGGQIRVVNEWIQHLRSMPKEEFLRELQEHQWIPEEQVKAFVTMQQKETISANAQRPAVRSAPTERCKIDLAQIRLESEMANVIYVHLRRNPTLMLKWIEQEFPVSRDLEDNWVWFYHNKIHNDNDVLPRRKDFLWRQVAEQFTREHQQTPQQVQEQPAPEQQQGQSITQQVQEQPASGQQQGQVVTHPLQEQQRPQQVHEQRAPEQQQGQPTMQSLRPRKKRRRCKHSIVVISDDDDDE